MKDSTRFAVAAVDLDEAVQFAVDHLKSVAVEDEFRGFTTPELIEETFERRDGEWVRVFRFQSELLPEVS